MGMQLREIAEFLTDLPDGAVEADDGGDFLVWPGRPTLDAIGQLLIGMGCELEPVECADFKGWDMGFRYRGRRLWVRVTQIERHVACFADPKLWPKIVGGRHPLYLELLGRLAEALDQDPRFHEISWHALKAFDPHRSEAAEGA